MSQRVSREGLPFGSVRKLRRQALLSRLKMTMSTNRSVLQETDSIRMSRQVV